METEHFLRKEGKALIAACPPPRELVLGERLSTAPGSLGKFWLH